MSTSAYLLLAGDENLEAVAVYVGGQPGAEKAARALTRKRQDLAPEMRDVRVGGSIDLVATDGAKR